MTDVCTVALLPTKPSSDDDSGLRHSFGVKASLPLAWSDPAVTIPPDFVGFSSLYGIAISTLMQLEPYLGSFLCISSCLTEKVLVKNMEVELVMKPQHPTTIGNI